ncbi:hypothetical protein MGYG_06873 [Nannizzia gypsea CBS 118893]|uniref:Helicase ATP-binding domain-containing protein n=1 Tax=Arthroderma gypseum (strain ATCC MYA-4604 / CBS 118893) TaxID=535722 RepID=E4V1F9_ARTGP|nr:hypothetical protein MGYG_06873 [Nannizzia gypsea CBS 118893]EFR03874.1 hypothetical protein MGYG_06873 [Nannizzia gypsea CBS 118893]
MPSSHLSHCESPPSSPRGSSNSTCMTAETCASPIDTERDQAHCDLSYFIPVGVLWWRTPDASQTPEADSLQGYCPEADSLQLLEDAGLIKLSVGQESAERWIGVQIYVIPEERAPDLPPRTYQRLRRALKAVMSRIDPSPDAWEGRRCNPVQVEAGSGCESLFYIFNTLESPKPEAAHVSDSWSKMAVSNLLYAGDDDSSLGILGLRTRLYPYQQRSAAMMIQKEAEPSLSLDPRLQTRHSPKGRKYYYDREEGTVLDEPKFYSNVAGGILAETMGYGKTLICLAVILATRGHMPSIPSQYVRPPPVRSQTGSLLDMAAAAAGANSLPWQSHFRALESDGMHFDRCVDACKKNRGTYTITQTPKYGRRSTMHVRDSSITMQLSSATLVIVPPNLIDHWLNEIAKHTEGLMVLVLRDSSISTPSATELLKYDIVLFSQPRFKKESGGFTASGPVTYSSPLRNLHWLRIIVDEGHNFASTGGKTSSVYMLDKLQVERRWIVSGTPWKGLYGVEVSLAAEKTLSSMPEEEKIRDILNARKDAQNLLNDELKRLDSLRYMVIDFLNLKPWSNSRAADPASWTKYMTPIGPDGKRMMSPSLRATLQSLVVRHRSEDLQRELPLPKLHNEAVYLEPTCYDKASLNLFILRIVVNAITSERTGDDYLFHPRNRKHLGQLMNNLRLAGFWWPAVETEEIQKTTLKVAKEYLQKNMFRLADEELNLLHQAIATGEKVLSFSSRNSLCEKEDVGIVVDCFPKHARGFWAINERAVHHDPLLLGLSLAREAQKFVTARLCEVDPGEGLAGAGIKAKRQRYKKPEPSGQSCHKQKPEEVVYVSHRPKSEKVNHIKSSRNKKVLESRVERDIIFYESETRFWIAEGSTTKHRFSHLRADFESVAKVGASHGLHIAAASRVFIVNPIWDPNIESQAIKRAHRISQTRPVYVETLVLKDTLEDKMLRRRKAMTSTEMQHAEKDMLDDGTMSSIIKNEGFLELPDDLTFPAPACFSSALGLFDRHSLSIPENYVDPPSPPPAERPEPITSDITPDSPTSDNKRRRANFPEFDLLTPSPEKSSPKRRRELHTEEVVNENGIVFISPRRRTPRRIRRTSSSTSSGSSTRSNVGSSA